MISSAANFAWEEIRSVAFSSLGSTFVKVGTPIDNPSRAYNLTNGTNANVIVGFSDAGALAADVVANTVVLTLTTKQQDIATNKIGPVDQLQLPKYTQVWVKLETGATATSGNFYFETSYATNI